MATAIKTEERPPRIAHYQLCRGKLVKVTVERCSEPDSPETEVELLDISRSGVKLSASINLPINENLRVNLEIPESNVKMSLPAQVSWSRPQEDDQWRFGCQFSPSLAEDTLAELAAGGFLQRREDPREEVEIEATIRWEGTDKSIPMRITDISSGGFCMACFDAAVIGSRFLLEITDPSGHTDQIPARVQWQREGEKGSLTGKSMFFLGCMFLDHQGYRMLLESLPKDEAARPVENDSPRWRGLLSWALRRNKKK